MKINRSKSWTGDASVLRAKFRKNRASIGNIFDVLLPEPRTFKQLGFPRKKTRRSSLLSYFGRPKKYLVDVHFRHSTLFECNITKHNIQFCSLASYNYERSSNLKVQRYSAFELTIILAGVGVAEKT